MHSRFLAKKTGMHVRSSIPADFGSSHAFQISSKKKGGIPQDGFADQFHFHRHLVQFLQKKKVNKKKGEERICGADLLSRTNLDNEIEQKGVSTMENQVLYPRAAPIFDQYLFLENPKLD